MVSASDLACSVFFGVETYDIICPRINALKASYSLKISGESLVSKNMKETWASKEDLRLHCLEGDTARNANVSGYGGVV